MIVREFSQQKEKREKLQQRNMDYITFLLWVLIAWVTIHFLVSLVKSSKLNPRKLPPGPLPLPIFGNLFQLGKKPHEDLAALARTHGPVMTLQFGQITTVIISSAAVAKEVLQKKDLSFSSRTVFDALTALNHHEISMGTLPVSAPWRNLRKICNSVLFSNSRLDANKNLRQKKVAELLSYLHRSAEAGVAVDIGQAVFSTTLNLLSTAFFSMDLVDPGTDTAREFRDLVETIAVEAGKPNVADFFPVLKRLDPQRIRYRMGILFEKMIDMFKSKIDQRLLAKKDGSVEVGDALDDLLNIMQENGEEINRSTVEHLLLDLFTAGTDTTSSTIERAMVVLLRNPEKLKQAQAELDQVIGRGNPVEEGDVARLPYLQSIVKEALRLYPPIPFLLPRMVHTDVDLCGFVVPKSAQVLVNAWAIGRDPNFWTNPNSFMPERFMGLEIDAKGQDFELIPFGAGRRICPGMTLAMRMLHLVLGSLIHSFNWKLEIGAELESIDIDNLCETSSHSLRIIPIRV